MAVPTVFSHKNQTRTSETKGTTLDGRDALRNVLKTDDCEGIRSFSRIPSIPNYKK